jgi:invasion protein IalB
VKISIKLLSVVAMLGFATTGLGHAQQAPKETAKEAARAKAAPKAAQNTATPATPAPSTEAASAQPSWTARCSSASRDTPLECAMEQTAVLSKTGQLIVLVNIRVPSDTRTPVVLVQLPLGLNLPGGAKLQVDEGNTTDLQIQTCENRGCYAGSSLSPELLAAMRSGKQLKVLFQNLAKETITIPMPLTDFATAYDKIK